MKNYTIRARILASFAVVLAVMLVMGGVAYTQLAHIEAQASGVEARTAPGLYYGTQIMVASLADYSLLQTEVIEEDPAAIGCMDRRAEGCSPGFTRTVSGRRNRQPHRRATDRCWVALHGCGC